MSNTDIQKLVDIVSKNPYISLIPIKSQDFVFEKRVGLNCFYCSKYDTKWTCPPRIPNINYKELLCEYDNIAVLKYERQFTLESFDNIRNESTNIVHKTLLELERYLYNNNDSLAVSFIGGSCKLCKVCGKDRCNNPGMARIPIEATGVNVIKSLYNIGIDVKFPLNNVFYRFGIIAW